MSSPKSDKAWTLAELQNGWGHWVAEMPVQFICMSGVVFIRGIATRPTVEFEKPAFILPEGYRPDAVMDFVSPYGIEAGGGVGSAVVRVKPNGEVIFAFGYSEYVPVTGVQFPVLDD